MQINYFFARLNVAATQDMFNPALKTKTDILKEGLTQSVFLVKKESKYRFTDFEISKPAKEMFMTGFLVKYKHETPLEVVDEKQGKIVSENIEEKVIAKVRFIIHVGSSLIMFHESGSLISKNIFTNAFEMLFQKALHNNVTCDIVLISETFTFLQELKKFDKIKQVKISLVPPNPHNAPRWERIGKRLQNLNATNYVEIIETKKETGSIKIDEGVKVKIAMAEDGYGVGTATGIQDGIERTISTVKKQNSVRAKAPASVNVLDTLNSLKGRLAQLLKRFKE